MTVTEIRPLGRRKSRVLTDEDFAFSLYRTELCAMGIREGAELSEEWLQKALFPLLIRRAKARILFLLRARDYTEAELRRKLSESGCPVCCAEKVLCWARDRHYTDDRRFAEHYVACHAAGRSRRRMLSELIEKGICRELAEELVEAAAPDETAQILAELKKRRYEAGSDDPKEKRKMAARLARQGYSWSRIENALREYGRKEGC